MEKVMKYMVLAVVLLPGLAAAECYRADADSGSLEFSGVVDGNRFNGRFASFDVALCLDDLDLTTARIEVNVDTASADTGNRMRDGELLGEHFFAVDAFPQASWTSADIQAEDDGFVAAGELDLRGVTANQAVRLELDDQNPPRLSGSAEIMRLDWQVGSGDPDFEDTDFLHNRVDLSFDLQLQPAGEGP